MYCKAFAGSPLALQVPHNPVTVAVAIEDPKRLVQAGVMARQG